MDNLHALILGIIEDLTEFLSISSTGRMTLGATILGTDISEFWKSFLVIIQLGSILAVLSVFWRKLFKGFDIWFKLAVGSFSTGFIGFVLYKRLKGFFNGYVAVVMPTLGGTVFTVIELAHKNKEYKTNSLEKVSFLQAFCIGIIQSLAMVPGASRSGASIIGGLLLGFNRKIAAESNSLFAIPTMIVVTAHSIYKEPELLSNANALIPLSIGLVTAFVAVVFVIKSSLEFISKFDFIPFGIYKIVLGILFFYLCYSGILNSGSEFKL